MLLKIWAQPKPQTLASIPTAAQYLLHALTYLVPLPPRRAKGTPVGLRELPRPAEAQPGLLDPQAWGPHDAR